MLGAALLLLAAPQVAAGAPAPDPPRYVRLERRLLPPRDALGRPWRVEVVRSDPASPEKVLASAGTDLDGTWLHARVPTRSPIRLRVVTEGGDVRWVSPVPFAPEGEGQEGAIELGMVPVRGVVRIGRQPLAGEVVFRDEEGLVVRLVSGADGTFEGALPRSGAWTAHVKSSAAALDRPLELEVPEPEPDAPAFVDVHFRDPALRGVVVDPKGKPVEGFTLVIREVGVSTETHEKFEGSTFRYERLGPGDYHVRVQAPWKSSPTYAVRIPHDDDPDFVRVVLGPRREFRGRVVSSTGAPVPGGWGLVTPDGDEGWSRRQVHPHGPLAEFRATLPESALRACLVLHSPGHAVLIGPWSVTEEEQPIRVSPVGGTLVLESPRVPGRWTLLVRNGCFEFPAGLAGRAGGALDDRGSHVRVVSPPMEPGPYTLCSVSSAGHAALRAGAPAPRSCVHGELTPGGRLTLSLLDVEEASNGVQAD